MFGKLVATCLANIVVVYLAAIFASPTDGWRNPLKAVIIGLVGGVLNFLPVVLTLQSKGDPSVPVPTEGGIWAALILSSIWYLVALIKFYGFGLGQVVAALVGMRIAGRVVAGLLKGF